MELVIPAQYQIRRAAEVMAKYMKERHSIFVRRIQGIPAPWTYDPILQNYRFCNVFRELDTVTIWVRQNIRIPFAHHKNLWIMLAIARCINWPPTLERLIGTKAWPDRPDWNPADLTEALETIGAEGGKVYTGAYMLRSDVGSKHKYTAETVVGLLWEDREAWETLLDKTPGVTLRDAWERFQQPRFRGWGGFLAYEVVTDWRHTRYLKGARDIYAWANAGPGAVRGLNRLFGRELKAKPSEAQTQQEMYLLMHELNKHPCPEMKRLFGPIESTRFEMRDIEHTLCEVDKYLRVESGTGRMRARYDARKATDLTYPYGFVALRPNQNSEVVS